MTLYHGIEYAFDDFSKHHATGIRNIIPRRSTRSDLHTDNSEKDIIKEGTNSKRT